MEFLGAKLPCFVYKVFQNWKWGILCFMSISYRVKIGNLDKNPRQILSRCLGSGAPSLCLQS